LISDTGPEDNGTPIPRQPKHVPVTDIHVANQFGSIEVDTKKQSMLCLPSTAVVP